MSLNFHQAIIAASRRRVSAFDPLSLTPALWLDASDADTLFDATSGGSTVAADGTVARWEDKSGNDRHGVGSGTLPTRRVNVQNGNDVIRWAAQGHFQTSLSYLIDNVDIFMVWNKTGNPSNGFTNINIPIGGNALTGGGARWNLTTNSNEGRTAQCRSNNGALTSAYATDVSLPSGAEINRLRGSATQVGGSRNGAAVTLVNHGLTPATTAGNFRIGEGNGGIHDFAIRADMMEVFIFNRHLTSGEITSLQNYLAAKWGITL